MKVKDETGWQAIIEANNDDYGAAVLRYADRWALLMEDHFDCSSFTIDEFLKSSAETLSQAADTEGITGFMYGAAVATLSKVWVYGKALKKWHNKQYTDKDIDGVVNPAIFTVNCD